MNNISYWLYNNNETDYDSKIENYISNIINYHIDRLHLHDKSQTNTIEVQILKNPENNIYPIFKKNETIFKYPILSCMVFLTDRDLPFVITEIDIDNYKYKEFKNQDTLNVIFPKKNTHVVFNGNTCNGFVIPKDTDTDTNTNTNNENPINAILINVWNNTETENTKPIIENTTTSEFIPLNNQLIWTNDLLTYNMYNNLLYMKKYTHQDMNPILELYNNDAPQNWYVITKSEINLKNDETFTNTNSKNNNQPNIKNRFLQRFTIKKILSSNTCEWLINTATKNDMILSSPPVQSHICMMENKEMNSFTRIMLETVCDEVNKSYNINNTLNGKIEITDVLLVEYDNNNTMNNGLKMYSNKDDHITAEIMLSTLANENNNNNKDGQLMFEDGLSVILNQGDMVIYSNLIAHSIQKISSENTVLYKIIIHMKINND
jgi:hypothetical protein